MEKKELHCSECGALIKEDYYECLDEWLNFDYFSDEENCFCSKECFCKYMSLEKVKGPTKEEKDFAEKIKG